LNSSPVDRSPNDNALVFGVGVGNGIQMGADGKFYANLPQFANRESSKKDGNLE
jgi:hypothetical protein